MTAVNTPEKTGNDRMVDRLKERGYIESEKVAEAFRSIDRKQFVPEKYCDRAYIDRPLPIGKDQTISAPSMVAISTELLDPGSQDQVLEIGSGSGYQAAILSEVAEVVGIEIEEELAERSRNKLEELGVENVEILQGVGLKAIFEDTKFDRILYSCAIPREEFERAKNYLEKDGILVAPVETSGGQFMKKFEKESGRTGEHSRVRFVSYRED